MLDPLEFLDPILHTLQFGYQVFDLGKSYLHQLIDNVEWFLRWMYARHEQLRNLGLLFAAFFGLLLLFWRGVSLDRSSKAAQKQAENAQMQAENASKSHVADTYTRAIEQLGAVDNTGKPNLEQRLGSLYALEKIAKANVDYHSQIMEVLCAYVRMHCPIKHEDNETDDTKPDENDSKPDYDPLRIDIQACLTVIGRRNMSFDKGMLDFNGTQIHGAILYRANLSGASFRGADLSWADVIRADLAMAFLSGANLSGANFREANLTSTYLSANLSGMILSGANLSKANLSGAKNLTCEQIQSANIDRQTVFPDYIKVTWAEDGTYTCEMVGDSN